MLPVLTFHSIDDLGRVTSFPTALFERALAMLDERGYHALALGEVVAHLHDGRPFPERSFAITFDDGHASVYERAFPLLVRHRMPATVFLTVGAPQPGASGAGRLPAFEGRPLLAWREIEEMRAAGIEFGAHTLTHPVLTQLGSDALERELVGAKELIEARLGAPVRGLAYPYGRHDPRVRERAAAHFTCAFTDRLGLVTSACDILALPRVDAYYLRSPRRLRRFFSPRFTRYLFLRGAARGLRRALSRSPQIRQ